MNKIKVSDYIIKYLENIGVNTIFTLSGGGCIHLVDSLRKSKKIRTIANLHEQSSAICADGYSQYTNKLGVAIVTTGPGALNTITGIAASFQDSIPVLIITGQVKTKFLNEKDKKRQHGPQEIDIVSIVKPITKYAKTIYDSYYVDYYLEKAINIAMSNRKGPILLDIPLDIQSAYIEDNLNCEKYINKKNTFTAIRNYYIQKKFYDLISSSKKPVILAGNGIKLSESENQFKKFIDKFQIPVLTTWKAMDLIDENHKLFFGRPGSIASRYSNFIQQNSDLIICLGTRLDPLQVGFNYENFAKNAIKFIVDIDENELNKSNDFIKININLNLFFKLINNEIFESNNISEWLNYCKEIKEKYPIFLPEYKEEKKYMNTYYFIDVLSEITPSDYVIIPASSGSASEITQQAWKVKEGQRIICNPGLGSMGFGISHAIGSCIASNYKETICIIGDGDLQHNLQELELIRRYQLPIKLFILNNNGYASIRNTQNNFFDKKNFICDSNTGVTLPNIGKIADLYEIKYGLLNNHDYLKENLSMILNYIGPCICELIIDPNLQTQPRIKNSIDENGNIISGSMENLFPFLSKEEFEKNMDI